VTAAKLSLAQLKESEAGGAVFRSHVLTGEETYVPIAIAYAGTADKDKALYWLEEAIRDNDTDLLIALKTAPEFDFMRREPRFQALLRRMGLPEWGFVFISIPSLCLSRQADAGAIFITVDPLDGITPGNLP
jgi:hypothetical protein